MAMGLLPQEVTAMLACSLQMEEAMGRMSIDLHPQLQTSRVCRCGGAVSEQNVQDFKGGPATV